MPRKMARQTLERHAGACYAGSRPYLGSGVLGSPENRYNLPHFRVHPGNPGLEPTTASARLACRSAATWTFITAGDRIRALTARHPIKPISASCRSAWQPNLGRRSTYRCGNSVQTTGTTSDIRIGHPVSRYGTDPMTANLLNAEDNVPGARRKGKVIQQCCAFHRSIERGLGVVKSDRVRQCLIVRSEGRDGDSNRKQIHFHCYSVQARAGR